VTTTALGSQLSALGGRYERFVARLTTAVLESRGETNPELRRAIASGKLADVPAELRSYVEKVSQHAYKVTDEDIAALQRAGYTDDQIFEVTAAAAVGAALARLERGLAVLEETA
jgi:alkylhydroperoxidase family enzyme